MNLSLNWNIELNGAELIGGIALCLILCGVFWYLYFWNRERRLTLSLREMIRQAQEGTLKLQRLDETELSAIENQLKRFLDDSLLAVGNQSAQREKIQTLISDISHQTLTPISNLGLYAELLEEQNPCEETHVIREQAQKLDFLIHSLVKLSRMENGIISVQGKEQGIQQLLDALREEYAKRAEEKRVELEICDTEITAVFDLKWTIEAVGNILDNAIKYTPGGGSVSVRVHRYSFFARIDISDSGRGIPKEEQSKIFTRFYRSPEVSEEPGVGIGLYLAREILQAQKGYIRVDSGNGMGSVFSVFLPTEVSKL